MKVARIPLRSSEPAEISSRIYFIPASTTETSFMIGVTAS